MASEAGKAMPWAVAVRLDGPAEAVAEAAELVGRVMAVTRTSRDYPNRTPATGVRRYLLALIEAVAGPEADHEGGEAER